MQGCWGASALISFGTAEAPASLPAQSAAEGMLGIRKKVAAVAAANELREEERDAATSMLTASSADTGSGSDDTAPQHSEPPRVKLWDESSMQYRDHHPPAATVSSADATGLRREQVEPSIDAKCAVADEEHDGDVDGRIRFGSLWRGLVCPLEWWAASRRHD